MDVIIILIQTWLPIIISIIAILVAIFWNQKLQKDQYKIQYRLIFVKEIYPPLAEDIRKSVILIHQYSQNKIIVGQLFDYLKTLYASTQIEFIKSDSPVLFSNLNRIMNEIIPQANNLYIVAQDYTNHIKESWGKYLFGKNIYNIDLNNYLGLIFTDIFWNLWKGEYGVAELNFERRNKEFGNNYSSGTKIPNKDDFKILLQIESEEKKIVNDEMIKMNKLINDIIDDKVIPELSKIIANPIS